MCQKGPSSAKKSYPGTGTESQEPECPIRANYRAQRMVCRAATEPEPMEGLMPALLQRSPNSIDVYCVPWSE